MKKRVAQVALFVLLSTLLVTIVSPIYECFDKWDHPAGGGDDTVLTVIGTLTIGGLALVFKLAIPKIFAILRQLIAEVQCEAGERIAFRFASFCYSARPPPIASTIPLRI